MPEITDAELRQFVQYQNLGTPGEVSKKITDLEADNKTQRDQIRDLKKLPTVPEGGRILTKDEVTEVEAYRALGTPEEVKAKVEKVPTLEADLAKRDRDDARDAAAKALGIEGKDLSPFAGADALEFLTKEEEVERNGKKEKAPVPYVKDADGKEHRLADYGKEKWGRPFEAVLGTAAPAPTGTRYTVETGQPAPRTGKVTAEDYRKATDATANYVI